MENKIKWETEMKAAKKQAKFENKPVLLDFFNPGWIGCQQMDAVTYPDKNVIEFITKNIIPLRVPYNLEPLATDFTIKWTPTLVVLDKNGKEHYRTVGFLPPEEFIPSLLLGIAKVHFELDQFKDAISNLEKILKDYPKSGAAPEAVYLHGVSNFKTTHERKPLKQAYERLTKEYPQSEWAKRALPYRLL